MGVTIKDIGRDLGLSFSTVSKALNDATDVADSTKHRVRTAARRLGYRPNRQARNLVTQRTHTVGYVIQNIYALYSPGITLGLERALRAHGYHMIFCHSNDARAEEATIVHNLLEMRVDGLAIIPATDGPDRATFADLLRDRVPFVLLDTYDPALPTSNVTSNDADSAATATRLLVDRGHRRIGFVCGPRHLHHMRERLAGWRRVLVDVGLPADDTLVAGNAWTTDAAAAATGRLLDLAAPPTAFLCATMGTALGAYRALAQRGKRIPDDVAVVTFGNPEAALQMHPPVTVMAQPALEFGEAAGELLIERIADPQAPPRTVVVPATLQLNASV